jgi:MFS family permease
MSSLTIGNLLFGFCTDSASVTILVRLVFLGMGSGWTTFLAPLAMELGGSERQTEVIGKVFAAGTFVQLIGPAVGGWTYGLFPRFPAAVPGLLGCFLGLAAVFASWSWLPKKQPYAIRPSEATSVESNGMFKEACKWPIPLIILLRSTQGFTNFAFFEVVPLWAISSTELGGLALTEDDLGIVLAISGVCSALFMLYGISGLTDFLGLRMAITAASMVVVVSFFAIPFLPNLYSLALVHAITNAAFGTMAAGYISTLNNATPSGQRASVNGISVTCESLMKGSGPLLAAEAFAFSLSLYGEAGRFVVFFCIAGVHVLLTIGTFLLPNSVNSSRPLEKVKQTPSCATSPSPLTIGEADNSAATWAAPLPSRNEDISSDDGDLVGKDDVLVEVEIAAVAGKLAAGSSSGVGGKDRKKLQKYKSKTEAIELEPLKTQDGLK